MLVCEDSDCVSKDSQQIYEGLKRLVNEKKLREEVKVSKSTCLDDCESGPNVLVYPQGIIYNRVSEKDLERIVNAHLEGKSASRLAHRKFLE